MPKMIVKKKAEVISEFDLSGSQTSFTIGSENNNDVVIADKLISMMHASIERTANRYFIRDLQSAFGTYVNGNRITDIVELRNGDKVQVGEHAIVFDNPLESMDISFDQKNGQGHTNLDEFEAKVRKEDLPLLRQGSIDKTNSIPYQLLAIYGPYEGKRYQLRQHETKIGRDDNLNDIILNKNKKGEADQSISRRHATIMYKDGSFFVADKRSKTRTYVNRTVVPEGGDVELFMNDEIEIVSDQQSTIFRLAEEGQLDYSPPKKAGVWLVRYKSKFTTGLVLAVALLGMFFATTGFRERTMLTQKPDPLTLELSYWATDKSMALQSMASDGVLADKVFSLVPAVSDVNGDGVPDIIMANVTNKPLLIDGVSKQAKWIIDTLPASPRSALQAADINQNQLSDLIYLSNDGRVVAIDGQYGAEIWISPFFGADLTGPPVVDDFDGDGLNDVAIADVDGNIHIGYNQVLTMEWSSISTRIPIACPLTSADLDKDGDSELVCGSERGIVFILDGVNKDIFGTIDINDELNQALGSVYEDNQIRYPVGIADLNGDGQEDLLITSVQGRIIAVDGSTRHRLWHDVLTSELTLRTDHPFPFALGDFDGDALYDVVTGSDQGEIRAYSGKGSHQKAKIIWSLMPDRPSAVYQSFVVGDINKDHTSDVIYTDEASMLWLIDGKSGTNLLGAAEPTTSEASMPLAADLESDGYLDIVMATKSGIVFQYKSNSRIPKGSVIWGQQFGQSQNRVKPAYELPATMKADMSMLVGILLFIGSGATTFVIRNRRKK